MICSVINCSFRTQGNDVPQNISFYEFPSELEAFNAWVAATGRENFIPNLSSKICSQHFDASSYLKSSGKLKKGAVPTLLLGGKSSGEKDSESREPQNPATDFVTCILGSDTGPLDVSPQTTHKTANVVLTSNQYLPDPENTVILNYDKSVKSSVSTTGPELQVLSQSIPATVPLSSKETIMSSQASGTSESKPSPCPIKLVDMKKLLEKPPVEGEETMSFIQNSSQKKEIEGNKKTLPLSNNNDEYSSKSSLVTVSTVLDCLRVILPRSFSLSRLKPSDKVAALVIKYLKLDNNKSLENTVKVNLKIIIDAAKLEDKEFANYVNHPYHKISYIPLKLALARVFPEEFSISDVTNEKLKCLCVVLSQDFFIDGTGILCDQIEKFICTERKSKETITQQSKKVNPLSLEKLRTDVHRDDNKTPQIPNKRQKLVDGCGQQNYPVKDPCIKNINDNVSGTRKSKLFPNEEKSNENVQKDTLSRQKGINSNKTDKRARLTSNLKLILKYIGLKKYSVQDVMNDNKRMIDLCQYLCIKCKRTNLLKLKKMLHFILQKKLNDHIPGMIEATINRTVRDKDNNKSVLEEQNVSQVMPQELKQVSLVKKKSEDKLKCKPVVVLQNLVDFAKEQLLFMGESGKRKSSRYHNLKVPHCFTQNNSLQKYSSDHVRKLTNDSYREFRKIVMKRDGEKVVFRLHYKTLSLGSSVFVKNFSYPSDGWLKGTVCKVNDPLRYTVRLDDGNIWSCVPEQLRPIPETEHRTQRNVKPRQLFDL